MEIMVIHASPRKKSSTDKVIDSFIKHSENDIIHDIYLYDKNIKYCTGCLICGKEGICIIDDDMHKLYDLFEKVDVVIFASPMYFNSISSAGKVMIDRTQLYWSKKFTLGTGITIEKVKKGIFICTAGVKHDEESIVAAKKVVEIFFKAINATYDIEIIVDDLDKNPIADQKELMKEITEIGKKFFN